MRDKKALVTGAFGFLGRHVARRLDAAGWHVDGIGHGDWPEDEWRRWGLDSWQGGSVCLEALQECRYAPSLVIHCAGSGSVGYSLDQPRLDFHRTVATTLDVLEFIRVNALDAHFVYPSSAGVYGAVTEMPISEGTLLEPVSPYGNHKRMAEESIVCYARHFGLSVSIVRLFSIYGPGLQKQLLWDACNKFSHGESAFFGHGGELRDWLHIKDAVELLLLAGEHAAPSHPIVNGGAGLGVSVREVLTRLQGALGRGGKPHFLGELKAGDPENYVADIRCASKWGWRPDVTLDQGIEEYVNWYLSRVPEG